MWAWRLSKVTSWLARIWVQSWVAVLFWWILFLFSNILNLQAIVMTILTHSYTAPHILRVVSQYDIFQIIFDSKRRNWTRLKSYRRLYGDQKIQKQIRFWVHLLSTEPIFLFSNLSVRLLFPIIFTGTKVGNKFLNSVPVNITPLYSDIKFLSYIVFFIW